jgi:hypothetical protein
MLVMQEPTKTSSILAPATSLRSLMLSGSLGAATISIGEEHPIQPGVDDAIAAALGEEVG